MHGLIHLVRSKRVLIEKLLWLLLVIGALVFAITESTKTYERYKKSPVIVIIEKDYINWKMGFPSITICERLKKEGSEKILKKFMNESGIPLEEKEQFSAYIDDVLFSSYYTYKSLIGYRDNSKKDYLPADQYVDLVDLFLKKVGRKITPKNRRTVLLLSAFLGAEMPENFTALPFVLTEYGGCTVFHSKLAQHYDITKFLDPATNFSIPFSSFVTNFTTNYDISVTFKDVTQTASKHQYLVFLTGVNELIDIATKTYVNRESRRSFKLKYGSYFDITSDPKIRTVSPKQRNCRFPEETEDMINTPVYSHNVCKMNCRIKLCLVYCNCTPYYYKRLDNEAICNMSGMFCLSGYSDIIISLQNGSTDLCPDCLPNCDSQELRLLNDNEQSIDFLNSELKITFQHLAKERYRKKLILTRTDVILQIAGLFSFFLGCSLLSFVEIIYFFTIRFFWGVVRHKSISADV